MLQVCLPCFFPNARSFSQARKPLALAMVRWNETSRFSTDVPLLRCHRRRTEQAEQSTEELLSLHNVGHYDLFDLELAPKTARQRNINCLDLILLYDTS